MARDYSGILAAVGTSLRAATAITGKLAVRNGSAANSIFYTRPPQDRSFPCITVRDIGIRPCQPQLSEDPTALSEVTLQISVWGVSNDIRPIIGEIDALLKDDWWAKSMDTADWQINLIDTSGTWSTLDVPQEFVGGTIPIEQRVKTFTVEAATKHEA